MAADTKKRDPGCTCHQEEGDSECVIHDPPTCKRCGCEYTMKWPDTEPTKYCNACAHAVVEAAEARAEKAEGERAELEAAQQRHLKLIRDLTQAPLPEDCVEARNRVGVLTATCATIRNERDAVTSELAEARRQLAEALDERDDANRKKRDVQAERDALKAGRAAGQWESYRGSTTMVRRDPYGHLVVSVFGGVPRRDDWGPPWAWTTWGADGAGRSHGAGDADAAKAAADAHLLAAGWYLAGGPHGAGEAK